VRHSVLFVGQAYYNHWYLSRRLRDLAWRADLVNIDGGHVGHYHGQDLELVGYQHTTAMWANATAGSTPPSAATTIYVACAPIPDSSARLPPARAIWHHH
jgi:hypothetical protein